MNIIEILGERLKDVRLDAQLNQEDMARIMKTTQSHYSKWEKGTKIITLKKLTLFCNYFSVSMDYMIGRTRNPQGNGIHTIDNKTIGKNLKTFRKEKKLTQKDIAKLFNTTQSVISAYEAGKTSLLTIFALQLTQIYNISLDWLCGRK